jgi:chitinase
VAQNSWDFAKYSVKFAGVTPPSSTPTPTPTPPGTGCKPAWSSTAVYTTGNEVSYNQHNWKAKWWTQNETPVASDWGVWQDEGAC